jgi:hypothetical protein
MTVGLFVKAAVDHHQFISDADSEVLYAYFDFWRTSDPAQILQPKKNGVNFVFNFIFFINLIMKKKQTKFTPFFLGCRICAGSLVRQKSK